MKYLSDQGLKIILVLLMKYLIFFVLFENSLMYAGLEESMNIADIDLGPFTKMMKYALAAAKNPRVIKF